MAGGVSAGVSGLEINGIRLGGIEALAGDTSAAVAARSMVANAVAQRVSVALGLAETFDWKGLAAAGLGAWAGRRMGERLRRPALTGSVTAAERAAATGMAASAVTAVAPGRAAGCHPGGRGILGINWDSAWATPWCLNRRLPSPARAGSLGRTLITKWGGY